MPLLVICNPVCGDGTAKALFEAHVLPLLEKHGKGVYKLVETTVDAHAGIALAQFLESTATSKDQVNVILGSGDGTLHDIVNYLPSIQLTGDRAGKPFPRIHFSLVPCGTANALYSSLFPPPSSDVDIAYRLQSVTSFLESKPAIPLSVAITNLSSPPFARKRPQTAVSSVVTSTALHASILHDSEALRKEIPSMERFKVAARNNSTKWYTSSVKLLPAPSIGVVEIYDPTTKTFIPHAESVLDDPIVDVEGPFAYFLSTVNVDRLEPQFRITPLSRTIPPSEATCDIIILRPLRDPSNDWDESPEAREAFVAKLWLVLGGAYSNGAHIDLRYNEEGEIVTEGDGPTVVEYVRCGGWEWSPDDMDPSAHFLCSDGAIFHIEQGGRAVCSAATPQEGAGFAVYA
ncbi:hypothetical protein BDQ12DRAFT_228430 [Crucibulum laeve]|uniref:DAGKc domain-containing protein n=1 Tax=Crucibulum laeve TaxID=68775 RepID=A0A5C3LWE8_9AGAR|nr:hypothetical protein BDQ12DRAFT_228430 [Crucibulum laeve]